MVLGSGTGGSSSSYRNRRALSIVAAFRLEAGAGEVSVRLLVSIFVWSLFQIVSLKSAAFPKNIPRSKCEDVCDGSRKVEPKNPAFGIDCEFA